jgi:ferric-dicitrate binding protein FerR (iron transport regulator)
MRTIEACQRVPGMPGAEVPSVVTETAADWVGRIREDLPPAAREAFVEWLESSPAHVEEFLRISCIQAAIIGSFERRTAWVKVLLQDLD